MAHGTPDWGLVGPKQTVYGLDDIGEAAVRLDSPVIWDRRGDVILMDSFEDGTSHMQAGFGAVGDTINIVAGTSRHGPLAMELYTTGGVGSRVEVIWDVCTTAEMVNGFEISFRVHEWVTDIDWWLSYFDGVDEHRAHMRWTQATADLQYEDDGGLWVVLDPNFPLGQTLDPIHVAKIVADFGSDLYVRVILDERTYPFFNIPIRVLNNPFGPLIRGMFQVFGTLGQIGYTMIDRVILTQNEPT